MVHLDPDSGAGMDQRHGVVTIGLHSLFRVLPVPEAEKRLLHLADRAFRNKQVDITHGTKVGRGVIPVRERDAFQERHHHARAAGVDNLGRGLDLHCREHARSASAPRSSGQ